MFQEWTHIQYLLKFSHDQKNNVLNRMKDISQRQIDQKARRKIAALLHTYSETQVRHASQAAASFYRWVCIYTLPLNIVSTSTIEVICLCKM